MLKIGAGMGAIWFFFSAAGQMRRAGWGLWPAAKWGPLWPAAELSEDCVKPSAGIAPNSRAGQMMWFWWPGAPS